MWRAHSDLPSAVQIVAVGTGELRADGGDAGVNTPNDDPVEFPLTWAEEIVVHVIRGECRGSINGEPQMIDSGRAVRIVQRERELCHITWRQETRERQVSDHRVPNDQR